MGFCISNKYKVTVFLSKYHIKNCDVNYIEDPSDDKANCDMNHLAI